MSAANTSLHLRKWLETPVISDSKVKKQRTKGSIKWEIFQEFIEIEKDSYWISSWERASKGKFPVGFFFNGKSLTYNNRNLTYVTNLKGELETDYRLVKHMFQFYGHIYSPDDLEIIKKKEFINKDNKESKKAHKVLEWSDYTKIQQHNLISRYVQKVSKQKNLCKEDERRFSQTLRIGLTTGRLTKKDITIENGKIKKIDNLKWLEDINGFYITVDYSVKPKKINKKVQEVDYGEYPRWNKWIEKVDGGNKKPKNKIIEIDNDKQNIDEFSSTIC